MDEGQRTFGILLIIGALAGGWLYNTGRVAAVWQAVQGKAVTGSTGTPVAQSVTPAYQEPAPQAGAPVIQAGPGVPVPPALQTNLIPNTLQGWLNPNPGGSFYAA